VSRSSFPPLPKTIPALRRLDYAKRRELKTYAPGSTSYSICIHELCRVQARRKRLGDLKPMFPELTRKRR
jgi:hypothetical protein